MKRKLQISLFDLAGNILRVIIVFHCDITRHQSIFYTSPIVKSEYEVMRLTAHLEGIDIRDGKIILYYPNGLVEIVRL